MVEEGLGTFVLTVLTQIKVETVVSFRERRNYRDHRTVQLCWCRSVLGEQMFQTRQLTTSF